MGNVVRQLCRSGRSKMVCHYDICGHMPGGGLGSNQGSKPDYFTSLSTTYVSRYYDICVAILRHR